MAGAAPLAGEDTCPAGEGYPLQPPLGFKGLPRAAYPAACRWMQRGSESRSMMPHVICCPTSVGLERLGG